MKLSISISYVGNSAAGFGNSERTAIQMGSTGQIGVGELPCLFWLLFLTKKKSNTVT